MKVQKSITLTIDYESIDITPDWVAFKISKTLETTSCHSGITDRITWNKYLEDPFVIPTNNVITYGVALIKPDIISTNVDFTTIISNEHCLFDFTFDFNILKDNPTYRLLKRNFILQEAFNYSPHDKVHYLTDFDNNVVYFEHYIPLPIIAESKENKHIFSCLHNLMQSNLFEILPFKNGFHKTRDDYIKLFKSALAYINDPTVAHVKLSECYPDFPNSIGTLTFKIENFTNFNEFFTLTKKYVGLEASHLGEFCELDFNLILSLALLKTYYNNLVHEDFFMLFPQEYKLAQSIFLEYKLKPKNNFVKKLKI